MILISSIYKKIKDLQYKKSATNKNWESPPPWENEGKEFQRWF